MRFEEMNWMDVEAYLEQDDRLILVLGATEEHGYLSLLTDIKIPQALADAASQQTGIPVAPALNFGISPSFLAFPGTISLRVSTFLDAIEDIIRSVYGYGFHRIMVVNGHGGNEPARQRIVELANQIPDLRVKWYSWWTAECISQISLKHGLPNNHANWEEAFHFTRVAELPNAEKPKVVIKEILNAKAEREVIGDGVYGGPYTAPDEVMDEMFIANLKDVLEMLKFE
jgi:creatinine amidohydrolase